MLALTFICIGQNQFFSACQTCQMKSDLRVMQFITQGTNYVYVQGIVTYFNFCLLLASYVGLDFHLHWPEPVLFGLPDLSNEKQS